MSMRPRSALCQTAILCLIVSAFAAVGQVQAQETSSKSAYLSLSVENDLFGAREDGHYTNGILLAYAPANAPSWLEKTAGRLPCVPCKKISGVEYVLGQQIFTPEDIDVPVLQVDDRPYAGWLYAGISLSGNRETDNPDISSDDTLTLTFGMVGPASLAENAQKFIHKVINNDPPRGWKYQLDNEPGVILTYKRRWQFSSSGRQTGGLEYDLSPHLIGVLGNIYTYAGSGIMWRLGRNLKNARADMFRPGFPSATYFDRQGGSGWHFFLGGEARAVAQNIFLDGNTFSHSHSVDKKHFVLDVQAGFAFRWKKLSVTFSEVFRTREFDGQDGADKFGTITLALALD